MKATLNKTEILTKAINISCNIPWLILHMEFSFWNYSDITSNMVLQNWQIVIKLLSIY